VLQLGETGDFGLSEQLRLQGRAEELTQQKYDVTTWELPLWFIVYRFTGNCIWVAGYSLDRLKITRLGFNLQPVNLSTFKSFHCAALASNIQSLCIVLFGEPTGAGVSPTTSFQLFSRKASKLAELVDRAGEGIKVR
jgi:hypothetical protein